MKKKKEEPKGKLVELTAKANTPKEKANILRTHGILVSSLAEKLNEMLK